MEPDDGYRTQWPDRSREDEEFLFELYRKMTPREKCNRVAALTRAWRQSTVAVLRERFPAATDRELQLRVAATYIDRPTMIAAFGWDPDAHGASVVDVLPQPDRGAPEDTVLCKLHRYQEGRGDADQHWQEVLGTLTQQREQIDIDFLREMAAKAQLSSLLERAMLESDQP